MFYKIGVLKNFTKFTGKHLYPSLLNKIAGLEPTTLLNKRLQPWRYNTSTQVLSCEFYKIFENTFFLKRLWVSPVGELWNYGNIHVRCSSIFIVDAEQVIAHCG